MKFVPKFNIVVSLPELCPSYTKMISIIPPSTEQLRCGLSINVFMFDEV